MRRIADMEHSTATTAAAFGPVHSAAPMTPILLESAVPELQQGDRLTRAEFERRYEAMPHLKKAELIDGTVYMGSPVSARHGIPHADLATWLGVYRAFTPGLETADNSTVRLDEENEPQPDVLLRIAPAHGGQSANDGPYFGGAPELVAEVAVSSASYDLHVKKNAYQRSGVREYLVHRVRDREFDWFILRDGGYERLAHEAGLFRSEAFPGLWLDAAALLAGDMKRVLEVVQQGIASPPHAEFVAKLQAAGQQRPS